MAQKVFEDLVCQKLKEADIRINGNNSWDLKVNDSRFYERVVREGSMGLGNSYVDGWFEVPQLDETIHRIMSANLERKSISIGQMLRLLFSSFLFNKQSKRRAKEVGEKHYDLGNDLFAAMLDKRLTYSCAYWKEGTNLDEAQEAKLDLICRKLSLQPGQRVLDIGCGWGSFIRYAVEKYGVEAVGITISQEQKEFVEKQSQGLPLEVRYQDYRDVQEKFDHIVSVGQFEHVGYKNYRTFFRLVDRCLNDDGLFLLHAIGGNHTTHTSDPWIEKYIFPNGKIPSIVQISKAFEGLFVMEDWHNFGAHYDKTLLAWHQNFCRSWDVLKGNYGEHFYRMWEYYLLACAGAFRARTLQLWQIVFSKKGVPGGYASIR